MGGVALSESRPLGRIGTELDATDEIWRFFRRQEFPAGQVGSTCRELSQGAEIRCQRLPPVAAESA